MEKKNNIIRNSVISSLLGMFILRQTLIPKEFLSVIIIMGIIVAIFYFKSRKKQDKKTRRIVIILISTLILVIGTTLSNLNEEYINSKLISVITDICFIQVFIVLIIEIIKRYKTEEMSIEEKILSWIVVIGFVLLGAFLIFISL